MKEYELNLHYQYAPNGRPIMSGELNCFQSNLYFHRLISPCKDPDILLPFWNARKGSEGNMQPTRWTLDRLGSCIMEFTAYINMHSYFVLKLNTLPGVDMLTIRILLVWW